MLAMDAGRWRKIRCIPGGLVKSRSKVWVTTVPPLRHTKDDIARSTTAPPLSLPKPGVSVLVDIPQNDGG